RRVLLVPDDEPHAAVRAAHHFVRRTLRFVLDLVPGAADVALDLEQGALGVEHRLTLGHLADQPLIVLEADDGWRRPVAFRVDEDYGLATLHHRDDAVGG